MIDNQAKAGTPENPLKVFFNSRHSVHFDDIEFQRKFEQNLIRFGLMTSIDVDKKISSIPTGGGASTSGSGCYWSKENTCLVYRDGNVGIGIYPDTNTLQVLGNAMIHSMVQQAFLEIRNWSDNDSFDPVVKFSVGATPAVKLVMGINDSNDDWFSVVYSTDLEIDPFTPIPMAFGVRGATVVINAVTNPPDQLGGQNIMATMSLLRLSAPSGIIESRQEHDFAGVAVFGYAGCRWTADPGNYFELIGPAAMAAPLSMTLPAADGIAAMLLGTDGAGILSFMSPCTTGAEPTPTYAGQLWLEEP